MDHSRGNRTSSDVQREQQPEAQLLDASIFESIFRIDVLGTSSAPARNIARASILVARSQEQRHEVGAE